MKPEIEAYIQATKETLVNEISQLEAACAEATGQLAALPRETPASLATCVAQEAVRLATSGLREAVKQMNTEAIAVGVDATRSASDGLLAARRALVADLENKTPMPEAITEALNCVVVALTASRKMFLQCLPKTSNAKADETKT